jgi:hypothetical protein
MVPLARPSCASWRAFGIGEEILGMLAAEPRDVPMAPSASNCRANCVAGRAHVVEADHIGHARSLGGGDHGAASSSEAPSGFRKHRLAEREGRLGDGAVGGLRRGDDNGLDLGIGHELRQSRAPREAVSGAVAFRRCVLEARSPSSRGRRLVSNTAPTADMATAWALPM